MTQATTSRSGILSGPWRKLLLSAHVVATVSVLGADLVLLVLGATGAGGADPQTIYPAAYLVGARLIAPLALFSLGTGLLLGITTPWGLLKYWWVTIKLAITAVLTGVVMYVLVPRLGVVADTVTGPAPHMLSNSQRVLLMAAPAAGSALLIANVLLAVFKPSWRVRSRTVGAPGRLSAQSE